MGVGKTVQAIAIMYVFKYQWPLMILCPSSLKYSWRDEILQWLPSIKASDIQLFKGGKEIFNPKSQIFIMSYDLAARKSEEIEGQKFQALIADECHYLKSRDAKRSINLIPILSQAKRCLLISGTPMLAKPVELFNLLNILRPDVFSSFKDFSQRYCAPRQGKYGMDYSGNSRCTELHSILTQNLMIRRLKKDVLHELPSKRRQKIEVTVDSKVVREIENLLFEAPKEPQQTLDFYGYNKISFDDYWDDQEENQSVGEENRLM